MTAHIREGASKLANLAPRVEEVLRIPGLERPFDVHDSETETVEAFSRSSTAAVTPSL